MADLSELETIALEIRQEVFRMFEAAGGGHLGGSFSLVELLTAIYFGDVLKYNPQNPSMPERDRFILSKGHSCASLYAVLAKAGFFDKSLLSTFCKDGTILGGHPDMYKIPGIEASTGALGHGFPFAIGMALAGKINKQSYRVFVILGDGECQEGSIWEAALFAAHHKLGNLTVVVDYNKLQAMDKLDEILKMEPFAEKWSAFGWAVQEVDGHNLEQVLNCVKKERDFDLGPRLIIAHTIKGKGVSFAENEPLWHYRTPNANEVKMAHEELKIRNLELKK